MTPILAAFILAQAQAGQCAPTGNIERFLSDRYKEHVVGGGVTPEGLLIVTANPDTGSFTVLLRRKDRMTCIVTAGTGYASVDAEKQGTPL